MSNFIAFCIRIIFHEQVFFTLMTGMFYLEIKYDHINNRHVFNSDVVTRV